MDTSKFLVVNKPRLKVNSALYNSMLSKNAEIDQNDNTLFIDGIFEDAEKDKEKISRFQEVIPKNLRDLN